MSKYPLKVGTCKQCSGDIIAKSASMVKPKIGRKFCNKTCQIIWQNINIPVSPRRRKILSDRAKKTIACRIMSNEEREAIRTRNTGDKSHFWKGGLTSLNRSLRSTNKIKDWRNAIFKRDHYTCVLCGITKCDLEADHIKPFSLIIKENNITSLSEGLACSELWSLSNGRTLCKPCHRQTETFGKKAVMKFASVRL